MKRVVPRFSVAQNKLKIKTADLFRVRRFYFSGLLYSNGFKACIASALAADLGKRSRACGRIGVGAHAGLQVEQRIGVLAEVASTGA